MLKSIAVSVFSLFVIATPAFADDAAKAPVTEPVCRTLDYIKEENKQFTPTFLELPADKGALLKAAIVAQDGADNLDPRITKLVLGKTPIAPDKTFIYGFGDDSCAYGGGVVSDDFVIDAFTKKPIL